MTRANTAAAVREEAPVAPAIKIPVQISPPSFALVPRRIRNRGLLTSTLLHAMAMAALIWLPKLFPAPVVVVADRLKKSEATEAVPLVLPRLPELASQGAGSLPSSGKARSNAAQSIKPPLEPPLEEPDYVKPQSIVSMVPNAVNRVQTILRPDLVRPPAMKFPVRLQSMVNLPAATLPVLSPPPRVEPKVEPVIEAANEIPLPKLSTPTPVLTLTAQKASVVKPKTAANPSAVAPNFKALAKVQGSALKAVIVVNAVDVEPDSEVRLPDAQLAGLFVVGPSPDTNAAAKSLIAGNGHSPVEAPVSSAVSPSHPSSEGGTTNGSGKDRSASTIAGSTPATVSIGSGPGSGNGSGSGTPASGKAGAGEGAGAGSIPGSGSASGAPGRANGSGNTSGISISGGVPGRGSASVAKAAPVNRSYPMMIISGGSSGGASRDLGVFERNETVYSVTIPMSDAGGGPDWTMQYALLNRSQSGAGLLVPPFVQKKSGATMPKSQLAESGAVFITGVIDATGKLQGLRALRAQDPRSLAALQALQQWEFLPAQLDGRAVASKVLLGVTVIASQ